MELWNLPGSTWHSVIRLTTFRTLTILSFISYYKESNAGTLPPKKDTVHHSLENHLAALYIFIMSQADTYKSLICVISLLQLHSHHYILDWCCRNKRPQQNYTVNPVSVMDHHCGWPLKLCIHSGTVKLKWDPVSVHRSSWQGWN